MRTRGRTQKPNGCIDFGCYFLLLMVFSPAMLYLGISSVHDELALRDKGVIVDARVTDARVEKTNNGETYELKYLFSADGGTTWYSHSDRTGRYDLWGPVTKDQWQVSQATRKVKITYLPDAPWINRPVQSIITMFDSWAGVILGIGPWVIVLFIRISNKKYSKPAQPSI